MQTVFSIDHNAVKPTPGDVYGVDLAGLLVDHARRVGQVRRRSSCGPTTTARAASWRWPPWPARQSGPAAGGSALVHAARRPRRLAVLRRQRHHPGDLGAVGHRGPRGRHARAGPPGRADRRRPSSRSCSPSSASAPTWSAGSSGRSWSSGSPCWPCSGVPQVVARPGHPARALARTTPCSFVAGAPLHRVRRHGCRRPVDHRRRGAVRRHGPLRTRRPSGAPGSSSSSLP